MKSIAREEFWNETRRHNLIPGGAHTYSRGDDTFTSNAPELLARGKGAHVWDRRGRKYLDWAMSLKSIAIGHATDSIDLRAFSYARKGISLCRPTEDEFELANSLRALIPSAEMVKFGKNGSDATAGAIRLARAYTGRSLILRPESDPFLGVHDWFIGSTILNRGVPDQVKALTISFLAGILTDLEDKLITNAGQVAAVIMEPVITESTGKSYYQHVARITKKHGVLLIFDETITGFRYSLGGAQEVLDVTPDLSTFGKAIGNGYPLSALVGKSEIMRLGGIKHEEKRVFLMSSTAGPERVSIGAARATLDFMVKHKVPQVLEEVGGSLMCSLIEEAKDAGLTERFRVTGHMSSPAVSILDSDGHPDAVLKTLMMEELIDCGVLISSNLFSPAYCHRGKSLKTTQKIMRTVFQRLSEAVHSGKALESFVKGRVVKPVFRPYN